MSLSQIVSFALRGIALAMGVAIVVMGILGTGDPSSFAQMLGLGLACLSLWALQKGPAG